MDILFVGFSSIVQRKVLPAAIKSNRIGKISLATRKKPELSGMPESDLGNIYDDYDKAIENTSNSLVYISFPNALHAAWAEKALLAGHHVIVDKPAFMTLDQAERLVNLANNNSLLLAEANVWNYHTLFTEIKNHTGGKSPHSVYANFSSPPLEPENFRYKPEMGAGILYDRGSYAIRCVSELFHDHPEKVYCSQRYSGSMKDVDTDLSILMEFSDKSTFLGFFSLECEYTNSLEVIGEDFRIYANRIFTPPPEVELELEIQHENTKSAVKTLSCDTFQMFLEDIVNSINDATYKKFNELLLNDATLFERLLNASHKQSA